MKKMKQLLSAVLAATTLAAATPAVLAAAPDYATRGEVANMLLQAANDYNPGVKYTDILKGYANGNLDEDGSITRAQALVMLKRAFGTLPVPKGDNARSGYSASNFKDVPTWCATDLKNVFDSGIVAGTTATTFSPYGKVTTHQMELFIDRVYALEGSNLKDDFYATVNKTALDNSVIQPGYGGSGSFYDLTVTVDQQVATLIQEAAASPKTDSEKKISALYNNILDVTTRNEEGIAPIQKYLDAINSAATLQNLIDACGVMYQELGVSFLMGFGLDVDDKDSTTYTLSFDSISPSLGQSGYAGATDAQKNAYLTYLSTLLQLMGQEKASAQQQSEAIWDIETAIASVSLTNSEMGDVDKTYNIYTMAQLQALFPHVDLKGVFAWTGLQQTDKIKVSDPGKLKAAAALFDEEHLPLLKTLCRLGLASTFGVTLNQEFTDAAVAFNQAYSGISGALSDEEQAAQFVQTLLSDYLGEAYVSRYFSAKAKADVEKMVKDIIAVYKERINNLTWMSSATKAKAINKLNTMKIKIGYPDKWSTTLDSAQILPASQGGSFFKNLIEIQKTYRKLFIQQQQKNPDKEAFGFPVYTVNAQYDPNVNSIEFPAGILQAPFYDINASYEHNLGSIGYIIAHEITHAFDNNGAKYDENGNATDWWTQADYAAFQELCDKVVALYNGKEAAPGITCDGTLTLSENIADLGSMACITELEGKQAHPDYQALYTAAGQIWCGSYSREMKQQLALVDVHAPDKLRGGLVMANFQQFYDAFGIQAGDGMWLAPADRVVIW